MTEAEAVEALTQHWIDTWPLVQPAVPFAFLGESYSAAETWCRVTFQHSTRNVESAGRVRRLRSDGNVFVQIFVRTDVGARAAALLADSVRAVYELRSIPVGLESITLRGAASRESSSDGKWSMSIVTVPFDYPQQRAAT